MFEDRYLTCRDCGNEFTFTASEQQFYADKGFTNDPGRCPECRAARKNDRRGNSGGYRQQRQMYQVICDECGKETEVPFQPSGGRPVYCSDCFRQQKSY